MAAAADPRYSGVGSEIEPQTESRGSAMLPVCSVFSQLLQLFSRAEFERAVKQHKAERCAKGKFSGRRAAYAHVASDY
jgi:hypothetical protein